MMEYAPLPFSSGANATIITVPGHVTAISPEIALVAGLMIIIMPALVFYLRTDSLLVSAFMVFAMSALMYSLGYVPSWLLLLEFECVVILLLRWLHKGGYAKGKLANAGARARAWLAARGITITKGFLDWLFAPVPTMPNGTPIFVPGRLLLGMIVIMLFIPALPILSRFFPALAPLNPLSPNFGPPVHRP